MEGAVRPRSLDEFLRQARVPYTTFRHPAAFTAQAEAAVSHVPGRAWAKIVVCFADDEPVLAVVPANLMVDFDRLCFLARARVLRLACEDEFAKLYPDCEPGAMAPFGNPSIKRVFVDETLVGESGTYTDAIRMHYGDFAEVVQPVVGIFAQRVAVARSRSDDSAV